MVERDAAIPLQTRKPLLEKRKREAYPERYTSLFGGLIII